MMNFQNDRKAKLSNYKLNNITSEKGEWRALLYDHILPIDQIEKNIISPIRKDFWSYYKSANIKLHQYFHHLNSSQALCFNLFFPLFYYDKKLLNYVLNDLIEVKNGEIIKCEFEKILDSKEFTNFDFYVEHKDNKRTLFEIKYTESKFATTAGGKGHSNKYEKIYKPRLEKILKSEFLNQNFIFNNYQIVRNLSYLNENTTVVFLFPKANLDLQKTENLISEIILQKYLNQVKVIYLEDFVLQILRNNYLKSIHPIYEIIENIYVN